MGGTSEGNNQARNILYSVRAGKLLSINAEHAVLVRSDGDILQGEKKDTEGMTQDNKMKNEQLTVAQSREPITRGKVIVADPEQMNVPASTPEQNNVPTSAPEQTGVPASIPKQNNDPASIPEESIVPASPPSPTPKHPSAPDIQTYSTSAAEERYEDNV